MKGRIGAQAKAATPNALACFMTSVINAVGALFFGVPDGAALIILGIWAWLLVKTVEDFITAGEKWDAERGRRTDGPDRWDS